MMPPGALLRLGTRNLMVHKLRSTLSILGVVFGVAAVVAMSSVGEGARREALAQVSALGIDSITIKNRPTPDASPRPGLRLSDVASLRAVVPNVVAAAAVREAPLQAEVTGRHTQVTAVGTTPDYAVAARLRLSRGRFLSDLDVSEAKRVAVLGAAAARELFPLQDPRGERFLDQRGDRVDGGADREVDDPVGMGAGGVAVRSDLVPGEVREPGGDGVAEVSAALDHRQRHSSCSWGGSASISGWSLSMTPILAAPPGEPRSSKKCTFAS